VALLIPEWHNPHHVNRDEWRWLVRTFLCPSDRSFSTNRDWPGVNKYVCNSGGMHVLGSAEVAPNPFDPEDLKRAGVMHYLSRVTFGDILDGLSTTAMFSENVRGPDPRGWDIYLVRSDSTVDETYQACREVRVGSDRPIIQRQGVSWGGAFQLLRGTTMSQHQIRFHAMGLQKLGEDGSESRRNCLRPPITEEASMS
jgi:hypothetical protein